MAEFYKKFQKDLKYAAKHMENIKRMEKPTDEKCEKCGAPLVIKWGKHGSFYACSTYDKEDENTCTFTKENPINLPDLDSADVQGTTQGRMCRELRPGRWFSSAVSNSQFVTSMDHHPGYEDHAALDQGKRFRIFRSTNCARNADAI